MSKSFNAAEDAQCVVLALLEHISEPVYVPKGSVNKIALDVSIEEMKFDQHEENKISFFMNSEDTTKITFKTISKPKLEIFKEFNSCNNISLFIPYHKKLAAELTTMLMNIDDLEEFFATSAYCRDQINSKLFAYAFSVALLHRSDTRNLRMPPYAQIFPDKFVDSNIFPDIYKNGFMDQMHQENLLKTRKEMLMLSESEWKEEKTEETIAEETKAWQMMEASTVEVSPDDSKPTASNLEPENRLAYFREDLGVNLHHWHWHCVYPNQGKMEVVNKNRRGELFYYMHQQIVARYDFERMCNQLPRVKRLTNLREPLEEAYFPKLFNSATNRCYGARPSGAILKNVDQLTNKNTKLAFDIDDLERWKNRIYDAIHSNRVVKSDGTTSELDIDTLGNMIEAVESLSPNSKFYGDLHNLGHMAIALCHDPDHRHLEPEGVMAFSATAMRDPIFYRWHAFINDMFVAYKNTLLPYTEEELNFNGIRVTSLEVTTGAEENTIQTSFQPFELELSRGVNFMVNRSVVAKFTRLTHDPFKYHFKVQNTSNGPRKGTVRIFLAPKRDESGELMHFVDQKNLFIELDRYLIQLPADSDEIEFTRQSKDSSVTIPLERTFQQLENPDKYVYLTSEKKNNSFCGCGWPENMLVPKGNAEGFECVVFVMVSNYEDDKVQQSTESGDDECPNGSSYCGVRDKLYPDRRSMGFPFDRRPKDGVNDLEGFLTPNMCKVDVKIRFKNGSMQ